jgi:hypothetical protein
MLIEEFANDINEARMVWRKSGNKLKKAVRCTGGRRAGRVVSHPRQCSAPVDLKKRLRLKRSKAKFGRRMARRAAMTKRRNPASRRLRTLNKPVRRK